MASISEIANSIRSIGAAAQSAAEAVSRATQAVDEFTEARRRERAEARDNESAISGGTQNTGGLGASSSQDNTYVTSKGMARAAAAARRSL